MRKARTIRREHKGNWRTAAASVAGAAHEKTGQSCQDSVRIHQTSNGNFFAALADGAGSAAFGEIGAKLAAEAAIAALIQTAPEEDPEKRLRHALLAARDRLEFEAEQHETTLRELATTLIVIVATPDSVAVAQVGDGATVMLDSAGRFRTLSAPHEADYINETVFLTAPDALDAAQVIVCREAAVNLAAFTDGLQRLALKFPDAEPHAGFFQPLFRFLIESENLAAVELELAALLRSPRITERTEDDLTLLIATFSHE